MFGRIQMKMQFMLRNFAQGARRVVNGPQASQWARRSVLPLMSVGYAWHSTQHVFLSTKKDTPKVAK